MTGPDDRYADVVRLDDYRPDTAAADAELLAAVVAKLEDIEAEYREAGDELGAHLADLFRRSLLRPT